MGLAMYATSVDVNKSLYISIKIKVLSSGTLLYKMKLFGVEWKKKIVYGIREV